MNLYTHSRHHEIRINSYAFIIGIVASITSYLFRKGVELIDSWFLAEDSKYSLLHYYSSVHPNHYLAIGIIILVPTIGGVITGYGVFHFAPEAKGHGIPNVMQSMYVEDGNMRFRVPIGKFLLSMITIGAGSSAGSEGPIAQIGAGLGSFIGQKLKLNPGEKNILIATGAAAGIGAIFNAPLGGTLFGIEILLASITLRSVVPVIIGVATAIATNYIAFGGFASVFQVPAYTINSPVEYFFFILLGVLTAFGGAIWQKSLALHEEFFDEKLKIPDSLKPGIGGFVVGILFLISTLELRGSSYGLIQKALRGFEYQSYDKQGLINLIFILLFFAFIKMLMTSLTLGSGASGGVFSPSLLMGAFIGAAYGILLHLLFPWLHVNPGLYAVLGMAALFGSVARAPLTMIIISTEMSGEYSLFPALMVTVSIGYIIHNLLLSESIYTEPLAKFGVTTHMRTADELLNFIPVQEIMNQEVLAIYDDSPASILKDVFWAFHHMGYLVVSRDLKIQGIVTLSNLQQAILHGKENMQIKDIMSTPVITVSPTTPVKKALDIMYQHGIGRLPVTIKDEEGKEIPVGWFTRSDVIKALESLQAILQKDHERKMKQIEEKIRIPLINAIPVTHPHFKQYVVTISYDWIGAYMEEREAVKKNSTVTKEE